MPTTGEKPGKGKYFCNRCGTRVVLDDNSDTLPPCLASGWYYSSYLIQGGTTGVRLINNLV